MMKNRRAGRCRFWSISTSSGNASSAPAWASPSASSLGFFFIEKIFDFLMAPARAALPPGTTLIYTQPGEAFSLYITVSLIAGALIAAPFIMYQVWMFIAPGLYSNEKQHGDSVRAVLDAGLPRRRGLQSLRRVPLHHDVLRELQLDRSDASCRSWTTCSASTRRCCSASASSSRCRPSCSSWPRCGWCTARFLAQHFKYALLLIFIVAAVITPTGDPMTQTIFAAPMIVLYGISIIVAWMVGPKRITSED